MSNRWSILALLFAVRTAMAIQYQSVAAVAPILTQSHGIGIADIGLLIALYLAPGILFALPGGAIGRWLGDKRTVLAGLALMIVGGAIMVVADTWSGQVTGRVISGLGGVLLNVLMSKMIVDWFAGREIATAMAVFVNSWPVGIAISLLVLPSLAVRYDVASTFMAVAILLVIGLALFAWLYREPSSTASAAPQGRAPERDVTVAVIVAGITWGLYNVGIAMVFGFGPAMLAERGFSVEGAGWMISLPLWLIALSVPAGGYLADALQRPIALIIGGSLALAVLLAAAPRLNGVFGVFCAIGIVGGLPAGAIMSLPASVLSPQTRAIGMGIYFTVFYVAMVAGPLVAGVIGQLVGSSAAAFDFGALTLVAACASTWVFVRLAAPARAAQAT